MHIYPTLYPLQFIEHIKHKQFHTGPLLATVFGQSNPIKAFINSWGSKQIWNHASNYIAKLSYVLVKHSMYVFVQ